MKLHTGMVLYLAMVCFQTKPGLSQETNLKRILKSENMRWIRNAQPQLVLNNYLKVAMLNQARIFIQTMKNKNKKQIVKVIKHRKLNPYKLMLS